jgi:hypothetical protein
MCCLRVRERPEAFIRVEEDCTHAVTVDVRAQQSDQCEQEERDAQLEAGSKHNFLAIRRRAVKEIPPAQHN